MLVIDKLHPELYDYIVDFLHNDDKALRACALVCHGWVPVTRFHLFYHIKLSGCGPSPTSSGWAQNTACRRIFHTVLTFPHLASYVNKLSIEEPHVARPATFRWVCEEITFPVLLKEFSNLHTVEFKFPAPRENDIKTGWSTMAFRDINAAMLAMKLRSFSLHQFSFASLEDFVTILDSCRGLKELRLEHVDINTPAHFSPPALENLLHLFSPALASQAPEERSQFETISLHSNSLSLIIPALLHPRSSLDISTLLNLAINITPDTYSHVLDILKSVPNLRQLHLDMHDDFDCEAHLDHRHTLDLTYLASLQSLSLQGRVLPGRFAPFSWLRNMLSTAGPTNKLLDFSLTLTVDKTLSSATPQSLNNTLVGWGDLDEILSDPRFDAMQKCGFHISMEAPAGHRSILEDVTQQLHKLEKKGIVEVNYREL